MREQQVALLFTWSIHRTTNHAFQNLARASDSPSVRVTAPTSSSLGQDTIEAEPFRCSLEGSRSN